MDRDITQAVIAAGGFGKRLDPFTRTMPKPMIPILGKPLLEWHIAQFKKHGVRTFLMTLHHLPHVIMDHFGDGSKFGVSIEYVIEEEPLGSAGALARAHQKLDRYFYFIYGDTLSLMDYGAMRDTFFKKKQAIGMQRVSFSKDHEDADLVELDADQKFLTVHCKPHVAPHKNAYRMRGVFILDRDILSFVDKGGRSDLAKDVIPRLIKAEKDFYGYECPDFSRGIDTTEKQKEVERNLQNEGVAPWW